MTAGSGDVRLHVDGVPVTVADGATVLDACRAAGRDQPTLCHVETLAPVNTCRICVVEMAGARTLVPACSRPVEPGMEVSTDTPRVRHARRMVLEFLASSADLSRAGPEVAGWIEKYGARPGRAGAASGAAKPPRVEDDLYVRDYGRCILCYQCVRVCGEQAQNSFAITVAGRGFDATIATEYDRPLPESACVYCGNCIAVCPTGALVGAVEFDLRTSGAWDEDRQHTTRTVCPYCGVGCNLDLVVQDGVIVRVDSPFDHDITSGNLCIKGRFGWRHLE